MTMRRYFFAALVLCIAGQLSAQGVFDALRFNDNSINGTARYMSMAGAFGALGGDPTSILDKPAGLSIYRGSEVTFTLNAIPSVSESNWGRRVSTNEFQKQKFNKDCFLTNLKRRIRKKKAKPRLNENLKNVSLK